MLRRLDLSNSYRSLSPGFWPQEIPLGRRTVIFGHNGSGKSSFASLLLEIATEKTPTPVVWEDEAGKSTRVKPGEAGPSPSMAVFTREWVQRNLAQFLDGNTASPIVTLGQEAIEARGEEASLELQIENFQEQKADAEKMQRESSDKAQKLARSAQSAIVDQLKSFDYKRFTKNKYSLPMVEDLLRQYRADFPDENESVEAVKRLGEPKSTKVNAIRDAPFALTVTLAETESLLAETPTSVALATLGVDQRRQKWAEEGVELHKDLDDCLFCAGPLTPKRRDELARHFDQSWFDIRQRAQSRARQARRQEMALHDWLDGLPEPESLYIEMREGYAANLEVVRASVIERLKLIDELTAILEAKADDPAVTPSAPKWPKTVDELSIAALQRAISEHNGQVDDHNSVVEARYELIQDHIVGSRADAFRQHEANALSAKDRVDSADSGASLAQRTLDAVRQRKFSHSEMAETLTRDLARVYGKHHLSVAVTDDGKSYACRRGSEPATHLSDGERTTLSLLYFLRKLEDESVTGEKKSRIVVIDDPSSSLDREALFATHQWLVDSLTDIDQFVVLTHDFGLLRLFLKSQGTAWNTSRKKIRKDDSDEKRFPEVAFLEMYASSTEGARGTQIAELPPMLVNHTTEYAYLFAKVMDGIVGGSTHDGLFLLPNAARRVLEVFTSYKAPHLGKFDQRLMDLMGGDPSANPYRDVYDFCNRYSHGEGNESVDVLDSRAIHGQVRRCMEFLKFADAEHFDRMCKATKSDGQAVSG